MSPFHPTANEIASATDDNTVRIWDAETGLVVGEPVPHDMDSGAVVQVAWSPNGSHLAMTCVDVVRLLDVRTRQVIFHLQESGSLNIAFSPDGSKLATAYQGDLKIWDVSTSAGKRGSDRPVQTFQADTSLTSVSYSLTGLILAGRPSSGRTVCTWREALTFTPCPKPSSDFASHRASNPSLSMHPNSTNRTLLYRRVVSADGWVYTAAGQRVIWVPYAGGKVTFDSGSLTVSPPCPP